METVQYKRGRRVSLSSLENSPADRFSEDMSFNIFIVEYTLRIHFTNDLNEIVEVGVESS